MDPKGKTRIMAKRRTIYGERKFIGEETEKVVLQISTAFECRLRGLRIDGDKRSREAIGVHEVRSIRTGPLLLFSLVTTRSPSAPLVTTRSPSAPLVPTRSPSAPLVPTRSPSAPLVPTRSPSAPLVAPKTIGPEVLNLTLTPLREAEVLLGERHVNVETLEATAFDEEWRVAEIFEVEIETWKDSVDVCLVADVEICL